MKKLNLLDIYKFSKKINYNIGLFIDEYTEFYDVNYPEILNFYNGANPVISYDNFIKLERLIKKVGKINNNIINNKNNLTNYLDWEFVDLITELRENLLYVSKIGKFLRSTKALVNYSSKIEFDYNLRQAQTLERVSHDVLDSPNYNNDWVEIATRNDLKEIDYDSTGKNPLKLSVELNTSNSTISGVVDFIVGERTLGVDLKRKITFKDNDLEYLGYKETFKQSVEILSELRKGDIPEFLSLGRNIYEGSNIAFFAFSSLLRDMTRVFSTDDTIASFSVIKLNLGTNNDIDIEYEVLSKVDKLINQNLLP